jgi:hypothetical protein
MYRRTKEQQKLYNKTYRDKHKEELSIKKKAYYSKPEIKIRYKAYKKLYYKENKLNLTKDTHEYIKNNREKYLLSRAKRSSKVKGLEFNLDLSDIQIPEYCTLLGIKLTSALGYGQLESNSSIDRIDSTKGYVKGNVWIISRKANTMKSNATKEQLILFANNIISKFGTR